MGKERNPVEAHRREQKKRELKKHRHERQQQKKAKLETLDTETLQEQLAKLERQVQLNPADGPTRKRKEELEHTLKAMAKKKQEEKEEQQQQSLEAAPKSLKEINASNREKFQNPEDSIYYHPTLNPFGAPPPGRPQMFRGAPPQAPPAPPQAPPAPPQAPPAPPRGGLELPARGPSIPPPPRHPPPPPSHPPPSMAEQDIPMQPPKRPGKRPPLPPTPPPPDTIKVPFQPPLPSGPVPSRPPPPPSQIADEYGASKVAVPSAPPMTTALPLPSGEEQEEPVVAPYPTKSEETQDVGYAQPTSMASMDGEDEMEREEKQEQLRSLVPTSLRVQRKNAAGGSSSTRHRTSVPLAPRAIQPKKAASMAPGPSAMTASAPGPQLPSAAVPSKSGSEADKKEDGSTSKEYEAFMEEMKKLGAM